MKKPSRKKITPPPHKFDFFDRVHISFLKTAGEIHGMEWRDEERFQQNVWFYSVRLDGKISNQWFNENSLSLTPDESKPKAN